MKREMFHSCPPDYQQNRDTTGAPFFKSMCGVSRYHERMEVNMFELFHTRAGTAVLPWFFLAQVCIVLYCIGHDILPCLGGVDVVCETRCYCRIPILYSLLSYLCSTYFVLSCRLTCTVLAFCTTLLDLLVRGRIASLGLLGNRLISIIISKP
jgi:hypothetical protein